jgi:hypothetical protein
MFNPNEYDDAVFIHYSSATNNAIGGMWRAGADLSDIEAAVADAIENATEVRVDVAITETET